MLTKREQRLFDKCDQIGKRHEVLALSSLERGYKRDAEEHQAKANIAWAIQRELYKDG